MRRERLAAYRGKLSRRRVTVPPILFFAAISLSAYGRGPLWRAGCCPVYPRGCDASKRGGTSARAIARAPTDEPAPRTLLPISRRSRLAADIAADAGGPLTPPFHPSPVPSRAIGGSALCCRLASHGCYHPCAPAYGFAGRPSTLRWARSREVPLGVGPSGGLSRADLLIIPCRQRPDLSGRRSLRQVCWRQLARMDRP